MPRLRTHHLGLRNRDHRHRRRPGRGVRPAVPLHNFLLGAGRLGLTQLANLDKLPITGALIVVSPLKLVGGTRSPEPCFAFVPRGNHSQAGDAAIAWAASSAISSPQPSPPESTVARACGRLGLRSPILDRTSGEKH